MDRRGPRPARRSRLVAAGLSVGALVGMVVGMVASEHPLPPPTTVVAPEGDAFSAGRPATPASNPPRARIPQTVTGAS